MKPKKRIVASKNLDDPYVYVTPTGMGKRHVSVSIGLFEMRRALKNPIGRTGTQKNRRTISIKHPKWIFENN